MHHNVTSFERRCETGNEAVSDIACRQDRTGVLEHVPSVGVIAEEARQPKCSARHKTQNCGQMNDISLVALACLVLVSVDAEFSDEVGPLSLFELLSIILLGSVLLLLCFAFAMLANCWEILIRVHDNGGR